MSNPKNPKDTTAVSEVFSISLDDGGTIPGVTQLLTPKALPKRKTEAPKPSLPKVAPQPSASESDSEISISFESEVAAPVEKTMVQTRPSPSSETSKAVTTGKLSDYGVQFELHFESERGIYRYTRVKCHAQSTLEPWQEKFFHQMKFDPAVLGIQIEFHEFSKGKHPFHEEAFGMQNAAHVQVLRITDDKTKFVVLFSSQSLVSKKSEIQGFFRSKESDDDSGGFKIELAS